jgi:F-type H+-transporting ATPase subunit alpha
MADVNPAEVSAILKKQLAGYTSANTLDEVGTVLEVGDGIARVFGLSNAQYGELVSFDNNLEGMVLNLEEDHVGGCTLRSIQRCKRRRYRKENSTNCLYQCGRRSCWTCCRYPRTSYRR